MTPQAPIGETTTASVAAVAVNRTRRRWARQTGPRVRRHGPGWTCPAPTVTLARLGPVERTVGDDEFGHTGIGQERGHAASHGPGPDDHGATTPARPEARPDCRHTWRLVGGVERRGRIERQVHVGEVLAGHDHRRLRHRRDVVSDTGPVRARLPTSSAWRNSRFMERRAVPSVRAISHARRT